MPHRYETMAGIHPPFTVVDATYDCGVTDVELFNGDLKADRMAVKIFYDNF